MSRTYTELKTEIARLKAEAGRVRRLELSTVIAELNQLIESYGITEAMILDAGREKSLSKPKTVLVPRFVDQVTGNTYRPRFGIGLVI